MTIEADAPDERVLVRMTLTHCDASDRWFYRSLRTAGISRRDANLLTVGRASGRVGPRINFARIDAAPQEPRSDDDL